MIPSQLLGGQGGKLQARQAIEDCIADAATVLKATFRDAVAGKVARGGPDVARLAFSVLECALDMEVTKEQGSALLRPMRPAAEIAEISERLRRAKQSATDAK